MADPVQLAEAGWGRPVCADCAPIAGGGPHLAGIAHELILHVGAAGGEWRLFQKNQVGVADDVVARPATGSW